jgi:hypothetical protein
MFEYSGQQPRERIIKLNECKTTYANGFDRVWIVNGLAFVVIFAKPSVKSQF